MGCAEIVTTVIDHVPVFVTRRETVVTHLHFDETVIAKTETVTEAETTMIIHDAKRPKMILLDATEITIVRPLMILGVGGMMGSEKRDWPGARGTRTRTREMVQEAKQLGITISRATVTAGTLLTTGKVAHSDKVVWNDVLLAEKTETRTSAETRIGSERRRRSLLGWTPTSPPATHLAGF